MTVFSRTVSAMVLPTTLAFAQVALSSGAVHALALKTLYPFSGGSDGSNPSASLLKIGGALYGTTQTGGTSNVGTVFEIDRKTGAEHVVYSFSGGSDGGNPAAELLDVGGILYGTTVFGGTWNVGTVFTINPATGAETVLHSFGGSDDGAIPYTALIKVGGALYGTTVQGAGTGCFEGLGCGTVFKIELATGVETVLHAFNGSDGSNPFATLLNVDGTLYGSTYRGGAGTGCVEDYGCGTIFKISRKTGVEAVLHSFSSDGSDGAGPQGALINVGGMLYGIANLDGTAGCSGPYGCGTVFKMDPVTGAITALHEFSGGSDGSHPTAALTDFGGTLYGATQLGGTSNAGTVFTIDPATGAETVVYSFNGGNDGRSPVAPLAKVGVALYSTTDAGGASDSGCGGSGCGTVFKFKP